MSSRAPQKKPEEQKTEKMCIGPACPEFKCLKKALRLARRGSTVTAICALTGDPCIGHKCQFASCSAHALTPEGKCLKEAFVEAGPETDIVKEAKKLEKETEKIKSMLKKIGLEDYL